jgi:hypothetical protein
MNTEEAIAKAASILQAVGIHGDGSLLLAVVERLQNEPTEPAKEARHWVTSPVIGETIDVATKADFSDARTVVIETIVNANAFDVVEHNRVTRVNLTYHHTRRPVDTRPEWTRGLTRGVAFEARRWNGDDWRRTEFRGHHETNGITDGLSWGSGFSVYADCRPLPPVDRRTLPCFENCIVGDEVEYQTVRDRQWVHAEVTKIQGSDAHRRAVFVKERCSGDSWCAADRLTAHEIRWPQSDAARIAEAIEEGRPRLVEAYRHNDELKATIAAKDAEIAALQKTLAGREESLAWSENARTELAAAAASFASRFNRDVAKEQARAMSTQRDTIAAHEKTIAELRAELTRERGIIRDQAARIADGSLAVAEYERAAERGRGYTGELKREVDTLRAQLATAEAGHGFAARDRATLDAIREALPIGLAYSRDQERNAILLSINALKSESRLVLPAGVLGQHPTPWHVDDRSSVRDAYGVTVVAPRALYGATEAEKMIARLICDAANRAVKS